MKKNVFCIMILAAVVIAMSGCGTPNTTGTARTAIERLVLSTAADRVVKELEINKVLAGKKVFLDTSRFEGTDKAYAIQAISEKLASGGAYMIEDKSKAEIIVKARAGALETDHSTFLFGIPAIPIPVAGSGTLTTPEIALFKKAKQTGTAKIALAAYSRDGRLLAATGPKHGQSYFTRWTLLIWINFDCSDVPVADDTLY